MANLSAGGINCDFVIYVDEKATSTSGGTFTSGAWRTRDLNTVVYSRQTGSDWASLASNVITLQPGSYFVEALAPAFRVNTHQIRFQNTADGTTAILGTSEFSSSVADYFSTNSYLTGEVTITAQKTFEVQHYGAITKAKNGLGNSVSFSPSHFATIKIVKLK